MLIPDKNGIIPDEFSVRLSSCKPGDKVRLAALSQDSTEFLKFLDNNKLSLGTEIEIISIEPFDNSMTVSYKNYSSKMFSQTVCDHLLVEQFKTLKPIYYIDLNHLL